VTGRGKIRLLKSKRVLDWVVKERSLHFSIAGSSLLSVLGAGWEGT